MNSFRDRVALVTGASGAIGRAVALDLAGRGAKVALGYRSSSDAAENLIEEVAARGSRAIGIAADVAVREEAESLVRRTVEEFGRLDILVNNAGIVRDALLMTMEDEDWRAVLDVNLTGAFHVTRPALREMIANRSGAVVNVSSISAWRGVAGQTNYAAAKAALIGMTRALSKEVGRLGIRVNAVAPGIIESPMTRDLRSDLAGRVIRETALRRAGRPSEVAAVVSFLASDEAAYVTGEVVVVDGGL